MAEKGLEFAKKVLKLKPDLLILDEINLAIKVNLLDVNVVLELLKKVPKKTTMLLTGRFANKKLIKKADFVTEFKMIKAPKKWPKAQKGIEY